MKNLSSWRVATRMQLLVGLTLVGLILLCLTALVQLKNTMLEDRKQKTRNLVEISLGILNHHHKLAQDGKLADEEARKGAREALRGLRFDGSDYFFILSTDHSYVLLPPKPENEGKNVRDVQDAKGKYLIQEIVSAGQNGGGFVDYWFPRPGQQTAEPKLSYAALFAPWGWVVGTGIYIDDVEREYRKSALVLGGISAVLLAVLIFFGWLVSSGILRQLGANRPWPPKSCNRSPPAISRRKSAIRQAAACCTPWERWWPPCGRWSGKSTTMPIAWCTTPSILPPPPTKSPGPPNTRPIPLRPWRPRSRS